MARNNTSVYTTPQGNLPKGTSPTQRIKFAPGMANHNPKRNPNSPAGKLYTLLTTCSELTLGEAAAKFKASRIKVPKGYGLASELRHCINKGWVSLVSE